MLERVKVKHKLKYQKLEKKEYFCIIMFFNKKIKIKFNNIQYKI